MQLVIIAVSASTTPLQGLASLSIYLFSAGACMIVVMTLAYLWYTIGSVRLARQVAREPRRVGKASTRQKKAASASSAEGSVATLVRDDIILHEQPDGEDPIALNRSLIAVGRIGTIIGWFAIVMLVLAQVLRTIVTQHAPWSNLFEFSVSFTIALLMSYLIFEARFRERVRAWGIYVCVLAIVTLLVAIVVGISYNLIQGSSQLIPALQDQPILTVHVSMAIFAYALFSVAFGAGAIMLIQGGEGRRFRWLPSAEAADELGYKAVIIGFPLLALNLILGAYWANYAWGHYWSWDPKETSALLTWLIYAVYLHARGMRGWRGKRIGWLLVIGFAATLFTYYGVSFLVPSLHSYATPQ